MLQRSITHWSSPALRDSVLPPQTFGGEWVDLGEVSYMDLTIGIGIAGRRSTLP
jgi:hypothetical protein